MSQQPKKAPIWVTKNWIVFKKKKKYKRAKMVLKKNRVRKIQIFRTQRRP